MKFYLGLVAFLGLFTGVLTRSTPPSDEETLKNLELEWSKCSNYTQKDADCFKNVMGPKLVVISPNGLLIEFTKNNIDAIYSKWLAENPNAKNVYDYSDIKVSVFGDTAIVTYSQKTTMVGYSNPKFNGSVEMSVVDTWQKESGKWKVLVSANVSRHPMPPEVYQSTP